MGSEGRYRPTDWPRVWARGEGGVDSCIGVRSRFVHYIGWLWGSRLHVIKGSGLHCNWVALGIGRRSGLDAPAARFPLRTYSCDTPKVLLERRAALLLSLRTLEKPLGAAKAWRLFPPPRVPHRAPPRRGGVSVTTWVPSCGVAIRERVGSPSRISGGSHSHSTLSTIHSWMPLLGR